MDKKTDVSGQLANAPVWSLIIKLSIPAILAQIVNLFYNLYHNSLLFGDYATIGVSWILAD